MMDWSERGNIRKRGPSWEPSARTQLFGADRQTSHGSKKNKLSGAQWKHLRKQKTNAAQQADGGQKARGAHSGKLCTRTNVNTEGSSHTKRLLSPGGIPQDAQSQVKCTKKPSGAQRKRLRKQKKQLLTNELTETGSLRRPLPANRALGPMSIPGAAVAQKYHCHPVGPQDAQSQVKHTKKPSGAQRKHLKKQKKAPYNS